MADLLYCVNGVSNEHRKFRYTQNQRRKEPKKKKYRNYLEERKNQLVNGKSVREWEAELSLFNKKSLNFELFKTYTAKKNELNALLSPFYGEYIFRKLKLGAYMRRQMGFHYTGFRRNPLSLA
jgi:hypothetical protein